MEFSDYITWIIGFSRCPTLSDEVPLLCCLDQYSRDIQQVAHELGFHFDNYFKRDVYVGRNECKAL